MPLICIFCSLCFQTSHRIAAHLMSSQQIFNPRMYFPATIASHQVQACSFCILLARQGTCWNQRSVHATEPQQLSLSLAPAHLASQKYIPREVICIRHSRPTSACALLMRILHAMSHLVAGAMVAGALLSNHRILIVQRFGRQQVRQRLAHSGRAMHRHNQRLRAPCSTVAPALSAGLDTSKASAMSG